MGIKTCIKCGEGGNVLVCSSSECLIAIHESCCVPSSLRVHDRENFCCPYCLYKQSVAECCQAKDKVLSAEKKLALYLGAKRSVNQEHETNISMDKSTTLQSHEEIINRERVRKDKERVQFQWTENDPNNGEYSLAHLRGTVSNEQASSSTRDKKQGYARNCKGSFKVAKCSNGIKLVKNEKKFDGQFYGNVSSKWEEGRVLVVEPVSACRPIHNDRTEVFSEIGRHSIENAIEFKNYSPGKACDPDTVITGDAEWIDKPNKKILNGGFYSRRKRVRWTTEEEEMLKKGVLVFSSSAKRNLPWRKILAYGSHVFHQSRTPLDLQSKWKNISRKEE